ncbi:MAG TPA: GFA family protein [Hyphomicrobiaceae bacterium]|nr:GFA family protein [Hyphomicrobiaceae bacterium]
MSGKPFARGHCLCGAVSFTTKAAPVASGQCHCKDCQRASGAGHMSLAFFNREDVEVKGETASYAVKADSGNTNTRHFCPKCGGRLFGENSARAGFLAISAGALDDNSWFAPQRVVYVKDRPVWDNTTTSVPNFEIMPPPPK